MSATFVLLQLAGFVALLLWGMRMVHTGMVRAFGGNLRRFLATGLKSRWKAFLAGMGITALLQSSTATALMSTSFIAAGFMTIVPALAVTLGANVGTTLIVQVLSFKVSAVAPLFMLAGVIAFNRGGRTRTRDLGRVSIGIGLILLALHLIVSTIEPVEKTAALRDLFAIVSADPIIDIVLAALLTWAAYSSIAAVLLIMTLAEHQIVAPVAAIALVLGANLGNVIPQYFAAGTNKAARQLALGNLIVRCAGCLVAIPVLPWLADAMAALDASPARQVANFHTLFNVALAVVFIGLLDPLARLCAKLIPPGPTAADPGAPQYLDAAVVKSPSLALADATREVLRMVDIVQTMLTTFLEALRSDDRKLLATLAEMDDDLDRLHNAVKQHLMAISRQDGLSEVDANRCSDILAFTINLEHVGDILDKNLRELAAKKIKRKLTFSDDGLEEISNMHRCLLDNLHLATSVFVLGDIQSARALMAEKDRMRDLEQEANDNHLRRLREGKPQSIETSSLHIDITRDLKRIAAHIASVAYPILERTGSIRRSRLRDEDTVPGEPQHRPS
ncbi:Na/Pi cotransporter family protein [Hyphomicrobium sp. CS1BSMeth3]|uniref:Na/Pi cotransporter family protein n=1 Tax=Hyphomicrobium sp. CS1BSMeth3 TaxID=1892844 RepID=UPI000930D9CD|nr:Na/Pi cotransporter family protein [Hyphomicrobium sp. CS1BSMeth3]